MPTLTHNYELNGNFDDPLTSIDIQPIGTGGVLSETSYTFPANDGLMLYVASVGILLCR
jgi:hypothetical protein